ncbi:MAG: metallophosphoesterase [Daejeonella sp.]|uniref:metallophosphoesterase family protein n=1 Tax=Daejeonella sp. TaxID=2805397 RepID=UPI003C7108D2
MKLRFRHILPIFLTAVIFSACVSLNSLESRTVAGLSDEQKDKPLTICVISHLNASYGSTSYPAEVSQVIRHLPNIKPDIILCAGDMVAGQKASLTDQNIHDMWAGFKSVVLDPIKKLEIPYGFTVGNHDASPSFLRDREISKNFWKENVKSTNLSFVDSTNYPFYYSYIKNNVFMISWDAAGAEIKPEVYTWMEKQLKSKIANRARLRILIGHLPLYALVESKNKPGEVNSDPEAALDFFKSFRIDLYISGHQHAYYPAEKDGVRFLNMGTIGDGPRKLIGNEAAPQKAYTIIEIPAANAKDFRYRTFTPGNQLISTQSLPDSVVGFNGVSKKDIR